MDFDPAVTAPRDLYRAMIASICPRPIAFVTSLSRSGVVNLAPFSFFNGVTSDPPVVSIAVARKRDGTKKDTWRNAEETGEFVVNAVIPDLMDAVITGARELPPEVSELELSKEATEPSVRVRPPRLARSPLHFECALLKVVEVEDVGLLLGRVLLLHARDEVLTDGLPDPRKITFVGRLGGDLYCRVNDLFERRRE